MNAGSNNGNGNNDNGARNDSVQLGFITNGSSNGFGASKQGNVSLPVLHNNQSGAKQVKRSLQPPTKTSFNNRLKFLVSMNDQNAP